MFESSGNNSIISFEDCIIKGAPENNLMLAKNGGTITNKNTKIITRKEQRKKKRISWLNRTTSIVSICAGLYGFWKD